MRVRLRSVLALTAICPAMTACVSGVGLGGQGGGPSPGAFGGFGSISQDLVLVSSVLGEQNEQAAGTGIVLTGTGEVLTNNHVIEGATSVKVSDAGTGQTYTATVAGYDRSHDVALLRLQGAHGLPTAPLDTSVRPRVGDRVAAVGNAGGTGSLSTASGAITALGQSITASDESSGSSEQLTGLIQVKANVRPGDSGGPLVDAAGKVIGVTTAAGSTYRFRGHSSTAGFAIPIGTALGIERQIAAGQASGTVHIGPTAQLGVEVSDSSPGTVSGGGAAVIGVLPGEPAEAAGLAADDVITSLDGVAVDSPTTLITLIDRDHPGQAVTIGWTDQSGLDQSATLTLATGPAG